MVKRFEVFMCDSRGSAKPCIVVSPNEMNDVLPYIIVAPITTVERSFPCRIGVRLKGQQGQIALDMMRAIPKTALIERLGVLPESTGKDIINLIQKMFDA